TLNTGSDVSGGGLVHLVNGVLTVNTADAIPSLQIDGGTLNGTATFNVSSLIWNGGTMSGSGTTNIPNPGMASLANGSSKSLQRTFSVVSGASVFVGGGGPLNMSSGGNVANAGLFEFTDDTGANDAGSDGG